MAKTRTVMANPTTTANPPTTVRALRRAAAAVCLCVAWSSHAGAAPDPVLPKEGQERSVAAQPIDPMRRGFDARKLGFQPLPGLSPWPINPEDPVSTLPSEEQMKGKVLEFGYLLMDLSAEADTAFDARNYARAAKFYTAVAKIAPTKSVGFVQLCASYVGLNDYTKALSACRLALPREGVRPLDYARVVALTLAVKETLSEKEIADLDAIFAHVKSQNVDYAPLEFARCDLAVRLESEARLAECLKPLSEKAADDPRTITYQWTLALMKRDWNAAHAWIERARKASVPEAGLRHMQVATQAVQMKPRVEEGPSQLWIVGVAALALTAATGVLVWVQRRRPRTPSAA